MAYVGAKGIRETYIKKKMEQNTSPDIVENYSKNDEEPLFSYGELHPEEEYDLGLYNKMIEEIAIDILAINNEVAHATTNYENLMNDVAIRLAAVDEALAAEEDRIKDLNVICGNYSQFTSVKAITKKDITGTVGIMENDVYVGNVTKQGEQHPTIISVEGNGYEGNEYVYKNNKFLKDAVNTSNRDNMVDGDLLTFYEYSRIKQIGDRQGVFPQDLNFDHEPVRCTITLYNADSFGMLTMQARQNTIVVEQAYYSVDGGITYIPALKEEIEINNKNKQYRDPNYAYNSYVISFPNTQFLKLQLRSDIITDDTLAFKNINNTDVSNPIEEILPLPNANRLSIAIDEIRVHTSQFGQGVLETDELITTPVDSIAIFANEYVPAHFPSFKDYIKYFLIVNGQEYEVVPINSDKSGSKVIRMAKYSITDKYVKHIHESIKKARLKIVITTPYPEGTPVLSNLKICYGKAEKK